MNKFLAGSIAVAGGVLVGFLFLRVFGERVVTMDWLLAIFVAIGGYAALVRKGKSKNQQ